VFAPKTKSELQEAVDAWCKMGKALTSSAISLANKFGAISGWDRIKHRESPPEIARGGARRAHGNHSEQVEHDAHAHSIDTLGRRRTRRVRRARIDRLPGEQ
jgi:hypothetical protein